MIAESHEDAFAKARLIKGQSLRCSIRQDHATRTGFLPRKPESSASVKAAYFLIASLALAIFISHQAELTYQADLNSIQFSKNDLQNVYTLLTLSGSTINFSVGTLAKPFSQRQTAENYQFQTENRHYKIGAFSGCLPDRACWRVLRKPKRFAEYLSASQTIVSRG